MVQGSSIASRYKSCNAVVYEDAGKKWLELSYRAPAADPQYDLKVLHNALDTAVSSRNAQYGVGRNAQRVKCTHTPITKDGSDNVVTYKIFGLDASGHDAPIAGTALKELRHFLKAEGCINEAASLYIGQIGDCTLLPLTPPVPTPATPAPMPAAPAQSAVPSLKMHYAKATPKAGSPTATLGLTYILNGPLFLNGSTTNALVNNDYTVMRAAIQQAIADYNIANVTQIDALIAYPKATTNSIPSEFDVSFSKPPAYSQLSLHELHGVADALQQAGCLQTQEAQAFKNAAAAQVPLLQLAGPNQVMPANAPPAANTAVPLLPYQSCGFKIGKNRFSQKNVVQMNYAFNGPIGSISQTHTQLRTAIEQAAQAVQVPGGAKIVANVGSTTSVAVYAGSNSLMRTTFDVEFESKLHQSRQNMLEADMVALLAELQKRGCISQTELPIFQSTVQAEAAKPNFARIR